MGTDDSRTLMLYVGFLGVPLFSSLDRFAQDRADGRELRAGWFQLGAFASSSTATSVGWGAPPQRRLSRDTGARGHLAHLRPLREAGARGHAEVHATIKGYALDQVIRCFSVRACQS